MNKGIIIGAIVVVVLGVGGFLVFHKGSNRYNSSNTNTNSSSNLSSNSASPATVGQGGGITIQANDTSATPETITATKGQKVTITFDVTTNGTYHGGLEFKSTDPAIDSGNIAEGTSKSVTFTATKSFKFTPYWYASSVQKDYFVTVTVK